MEEGAAGTVGTWLWLKNLIDSKSSSSTVKAYLNTVILVKESGESAEGNIYTEYLVFEDAKSTETYKYTYEKIGEIGGDVSRLITRVENLEKARVSGITSVGPRSAAITITHTQTPTTETGTEWSITANAASTSAYGVVKLSTSGAAGTSTELVVTEAQLKAVKDEIDDVVDGTTAVVGQVLTDTVDVESGASGTFSVDPRSGVSKVKILTVEDNAGEQWSYKLLTTDSTGETFQVWEDGDYAKIESGKVPTSFTVSYAVVALG